MKGTMTDAASSRERRHKRFHVSCNVEFYANDKMHRGVSDNVSIDGLLIRTDDLLALESVISVTVYLPDGSTSKLKGRVKRVHKVSSDAAAESGKNFKGGVGIEIMERDSNYLKFFMSLLSTIKF